MEQFDVLDENGNKTGQIKPRDLVHRDGDWHKGVHIWILNSDNELLVQKRSPQKDSYPNQWDISSAGHVPAGENSIEGAIREIKEELGIDTNKEDLKLLFTLKKKSVLKNGTFINNEFDDVYLAKLDFDITKLILQTEEVSEVKLITVDDLEKVLLSKDSTFVPHDEEYTRLIEYLRK